MNCKPPLKNTRVLLIGWDAADWKMINPLIEQGKMPNLKRLIDNGVSGNLSTLQPVLSPTLWSSIATGKRPYKHGVHGFTEPDPLTGSIRPVTNLSRKTKAIWNILNQEEKETITVGWWPSNPAEELSKGVMVSNDYQKSQGVNRDKWPMKKGTVHPPRLEGLLKELRFHPSELEESDVIPFIPAVQGMSEEDLKRVQKDPRLKTLSTLIADCTSIHSAATALMQNEPWDLMCVYYDAIDHFGHAFMKYHPPQQPKIDDWDFRVYNYCIEAGYLYHDMMLGTLMELADDDTTIMLISDHGFHPDDLRPSIIPREPAGPAIEHRQFGIFVAAGANIKKGEKTYGASLLDICPTLLHSFGLPSGKDMDGRVLEDIFQEHIEVKTIPSWDDQEGDHGMHSGEKQISPAESKAALQQLVALGYIDEPNANQSKALEETVRELEYNLAQSYIDGGIYREASAILERLYEKWPMEHRFGFQLTVCYKNQLKYQKLRKLVETIIKRRIEEAESAAQELKSLKLDDKDVQQKEAKLLKKMSEKEQKKFTLKRKNLFGKARPNIYSLRYLEAYVDYAEGLFEEALQKLDILDKDVGARRNALCLRGDVYSRLKRWSEARKTYTKALSHDREYPPALYGLARVSIAEKKFGEAAKYTEESTQLLYFQPPVHYLRGMAYYRSGKIAEAENAFITCVKQAPLFSAAYKKLADIAKHHRHDAHSYTLLRKHMLDSRKHMRQIRSEQSTNQEQAHTKSAIDALSMDLTVINQLSEPTTNLDSNKVITIVTGLPRTGTSLMMQILNAAGLKIFTDEKRSSDKSNPKGYFEHSLTSSLMKSQNKSWVLESKGKAIKVVAPLLASLPVKVKNGDAVESLQYRVVFMQRNMNEVLHSQETMLGHTNREAYNTTNISKAYIQQVTNAIKWCNEHQIPTIAIDYNQILTDPNDTISNLGKFLNLPKGIIPELHNVIDPSLYRSKEVIH